VLRRRELYFAKCPPRSEIGVLAPFLTSLIRDHHSHHPVGPLRRAALARRPSLLIVVDSSLAALGGFLTLDDGLPITGFRHVKWFRSRLQLEDLGYWQCLLKDKSLPRESRNMVAFELLSACVGLRLAERVFPNLQQYNVVILTDNESTKGILMK
ncbi:hypothetical protein FOL47_005129, partial [Perkinsus chesapeaki]